MYIKYYKTWCSLKLFLLILIGYSFVSSKYLSYQVIAYNSDTTKQLLLLLLALQDVFQPVGSASVAASLVETYIINVVKCHN